MLAFLTNMAPFLDIFQIFCFFDTLYEKFCHNAIVEISTKKKLICDTGSINMRFELTKFIVLLIFRILSHNDVITIL